MLTFFSESSRSRGFQGLDAGIKDRSAKGHAICRLETKSPNGDVIVAAFIPDIRVIELIRLQFVLELPIQLSRRRSVSDRDSVLKEVDDVFDFLETGLLLRSQGFESWVLCHFNSPFVFTNS